jgi:hypothetical protein
MTDANWVFDKAIHLMDEQNELNGETRTVDTKEYQYRTLSILNIIQEELYLFSDTYEVGQNGKRITPPELASFDQPINLDDAIARGVMPYGLAAHLLLGENDAMASFFNEKYENLMFKIGLRKPAVWEDIPLPLG